MKSLRLSFGFFAALAFLNALLSHHNIWPTPWVQLAPELSVEILIILAILALWRETTNRWPRFLLPALTVFIILFAVGRYADVTAPALFGRRINLYWDTQHIPNVAAMLLQTVPWWKSIAAVMGGLAFVAGLVAAVVISLRTVQTAFQRPFVRRATGISAAGLAAIFAVGMTNASLQWERWFSIPVAPVYAEQAAFLLKARPVQAAPAHTLEPSNLARIKGRDVFLIFLESYGATTIRDARHAEPLEPSFQAIENLLATSDWQAVSAMVESPTHAGGSWLAHASFLSGRWIKEQDDYHLFLAHPSETLIDRFRAAGYQTLALMPGIKRDWPEGTGYGFDQILDAKFLNYRGPAFGWWTIPDQFSLERLIQTASSPHIGKSVFAFFPTIMSHMPFGPTPPYQPDWQKLTSANPYPDAAVAAALAQEPDLSNLTPAYVQTMAYNLKILRGFLEHRAPAGSLVIVIGDHQPSAIISGENAPWTAPAHIFSTDGDLLRQLKGSGFVEGFRPPFQTTARMHELNPMLLRALHKDSETAQTAIGIEQR